MLMDPLGRSFPGESHCIVYFGMIPVLGPIACSFELL